MKWRTFGKNGGHDCDAATNIATMPYLSVAICTYNRDAYIVACLQHLALQQLDSRNFEVLVVNNNSTDNTEALVLAFLEQHKQLPFRYMFEEQKGVSFARQRAVNEARGEVVVFLDDDAEADSKLLKSYFDFFQGHADAAAAGGTIIPKYSEKPKPAWMSSWLNGYVARCEFGGVTRLYRGRMKYPIGCNMAYRKALMLQAGGFDTDLAFRSDDKHIYLEVNKINNQIYYLPHAIVHHNIPGKRLSFDYLRTLYLKTGNEEKVRMRKTGRPFAVACKFLEFVFKFGVSLVIWVLFALQAKEIKGRYVMFSQWFTLVGFLRKEVYVR